jgi:hypothetical protein
MASSYCRLLIFTDFGTFFTKPEERLYLYPVGLSLQSGTKNKKKNSPSQKTVSKQSMQARLIMLPAKPFARFPKQ